MFMVFLLCVNAYWWQGRTSNSRIRRDLLRGDLGSLRGRVLYVRKPGTQQVCGTDPVYRFYPGLPPNTTAIISGYLPFVGSWNCEANKIFSAHDAHGVFIRYFDSGQRSGLGAGVWPFDPSVWQMYVYTFPGPGEFRVKICKWLNAVDVADHNNQVQHSVCLYDYYTRSYNTGGSGAVTGFTVSGDVVRLYTPNSYQAIEVPGANKWNYFTVKCYVTGRSCMHKFVYNVTTAIVEVDGYGIERNFTVCEDCQGFDQNVFTVPQSGLIPNDFSFNNWFYLTDAATLVNGVTRSDQPLKVLCLTPIPKGSSTSLTVVNFTDVGTHCNGYRQDGPFEAARFNLNFTENVFTNGLQKLIISFGGYNGTVYCTNDTVYNGTIPSDSGKSVPFGVLDSAYYCFMNTTAGNGSVTVFLGSLPPVVRELVFTRDGRFYLNGFMFAEMPGISAIYLSLVTQEVAGFWTIAYTNFTDTLLQLNGTNINRILYCNDHYSKLCCDQLSFELEDAFYPNGRSSEYVLPKTYATLPTYVSHTDLTVELRGLGSVDYKDYVSLSHSCITTSYFTVTVSAHDDNFYGFKLGDTTCSFGFDKLNNYLTFGSICFYNTTMPGACQVSVLKRFANQPYQPTNLAIYITYTKGNKITGAPKIQPGITQTSVLHLDTCTDYTIYGMTGRGVIFKSNETFISGLYYTSGSGQLLAFKNSTTGDIFGIIPCQLSYQAAVINSKIVGIISSQENNTMGFERSVALPQFYYHYNEPEVENTTRHRRAVDSVGVVTCSDPVLSYGSFGVCADGTYKLIQMNVSNSDIKPISTGNISIPVNFTVSIQTEYIPITNTPVSVDCQNYVCNGNPSCLKVLQQYASACTNIERALQNSAKLESLELTSMLQFSADEYNTSMHLYTGDLEQFGSFNLSAILLRTPKTGGGISSRSAIEDLLFDKVVTNGLGTVDQDYKKCTGGQAIKDLICAQYYNGIMVLPSVADANLITMYSTSLAASMLGGIFTAPASATFSTAVFARLNYVALQTNVLQENQKILASAFNNAMDGITNALTSINNAITITSQALGTLATALNKVQDVVNSQGLSLQHLTTQLAQNFQAISASIDDIYNRLDKLEADAQVDRLITGRLAALNAYVSQALTRYAQMRNSRELAITKINECVKSQSQRFGFCGNGTHLFSVVNAAPNGFMFFHTVLVPTEWQPVQAWSGVCVDNSRAYIVKDVSLSLFNASDGKLMLTPRTMFEPRTPTVSDFVQIKSCVVEYLNITGDELPSLMPDIFDFNKTLEDLLSRLPNSSAPDLSLDQYNHTLLNLQNEIDKINGQAGALNATIDDLKQWIEYINNTRVDLQWLSKVETYIKWPWYVWLAIGLATIFACAILVFCCLSTGCCGCCGCFASFFSSCCASKRLPYYTEVEKVHVN